MKVLLIEYGGHNNSIFIDMPAALSYPMNMKKYNWGFNSEPEPNLLGRSLICPRGKGLGGSSSINGMVYVRGNPQTLIIGALKELQVGHSQMFFLTLKKWRLVKIKAHLGEGEMGLLE